MLIKSNYKNHLPTPCFFFFFNKTKVQTTIKISRKPPTPTTIAIMSCLLNTFLPSALGPPPGSTENKQHCKKSVEVNQSI